MGIINRGYAASEGKSRFGVTGDSALQRALKDHSLVREWWQADSGYDVFDGQVEWRGRKNGFRLIPLGTSFPVKTANVFGTRPGLTIGSVSKYISDPDGQAFLPLTGDWSIVTVARPGTLNDLGVAESLNWHVYGNQGAAGNFNSMMRLSTRVFRCYQEGVSVGTSAVVHAVGAPFYAMDCFNDAGNERKLRVNGVDEMTAPTTTKVVVNNALTIGAAQAAPGSGPGHPASAYGSVIVVAGNLQAAGNLALRTLIEDVIAEHYAGTVWG